MYVTMLRDDVVVVDVVVRILLPLDVLSGLFSLSLLASPEIASPSVCIAPALLRGAPTEDRFENMDQVLLLRLDALLLLPPLLAVAPGLTTCWETVVVPRGAKVSSSLRMDMS
jgi:hypothetical protein